MKTHYSINLKDFSLKKLKNVIQNQELLPSHRILLENMDARFQIIEANWLNNLLDLLQALKDKKRIEEFSIRSEIPVDYLTILRRNANQYVSKPVNIREFPGIDPNHIKQLEELNIKNSKYLFEETQTADDKKKLVIWKGDIQ